ncbi:MAG: hypothetical protein R3D01_14200 [Hyphomicrobiales bacterium]
MACLYRAMDALDNKGRKYLVDPVLDPIHFGFMASLERYAQVRRERPDAEILMGTGNLTELTDADTTGITAVLLGIASELQIEERSRGPGESAHAADCRGARPRPPHHVCRAPTMNCPRTMPTGCSRCTRENRSP